MTNLQQDTRPVRIIFLVVTKEATAIHKLPFIHTIQVSGVIIIATLSVSGLLHIQYVSSYNPSPFRFRSRIKYVTRPTSSSHQIHHARNVLM